MADESKVSITFGGYDDTGDGAINFEAPLRVVQSVDSVDALGLIDISRYEEGEPIAAYVKNVNDAEKGTIPYRGSFYRYNWESGGWEQVVLGNHSHANMELLDQLGAIDTDSMEIGEKKVLTIEKIDPDGDGNRITTDYRLSYEDQKGLPEVPADSDVKPQYLTAENGKVKWASSFLPAQTFKLVKVEVTESNRENDKTLILDREFIQDNSISYRKSLGDEIMIFDNGDLVPDMAIEAKEDSHLDLSEIRMTMPDLSSHTFDLGETITVLIIRSGVAGVMDTIADQYMTKAEAIGLLSNGAINLNQYITKSDLRKYAATAAHTHSGYLRKDEYDAFDYRYADYQHTHSEYMTRAQVLAILAEAAGADGEVDIDKTIETIVEDFQDQVADLKSDYYDRKQIIELIDSTKKEMADSDSIEVTINGQSLTEYLRNLADRQADVEHIDADAVELEADKVNLGEGETVGGYSDGDAISKGTTLTEFVHRLITREKIPSLDGPEFSVDVSQDSFVPGVMSTISITPHFRQNDAGRLESIQAMIYGDDIDSPIASIELANDEKTTQSLMMGAINGTGLCARIMVTAKYADGDDKISNVGKSYRIEGGSVSAEDTISCRIPFYIGSFVDDSDIDTDSMYERTETFGSSSGTHEIFQIFLTDEEIDEGYRTTIRVENLARQIVFAIPKSMGVKLKSLTFENQGFDMIDDFDEDDMGLKDATGSVSAEIGDYSVYHYKLAQTAQSDLAFTLRFARTGGSSK
jgi:molybdopterin converting factor small subunit